jgi:hypothetical protein
MTTLHRVRPSRDEVRPAVEKAVILPDGRVLFKAAKIESVGDIITRGNKLFIEDYVGGQYHLPFEVLSNKQEII